MSRRHAIPSRVWAGVCAALLTTLVAVPAAAQQPFIVDDADVTPGGRWHTELSTQVDLLRPAARPARWQNVFEWEVNYGVGRRLEIGALVPLVSLVSDASGPRRALHGVGDSALAAKWRLTKDVTAAHAAAVSMSLEIPSGSQARGLGTGLVDYGINLVSQHRLHPRLTLRVNGGGLLAGNTQTGAVGIKARGAVLTTGASLVVAAHRLVQIGGEITTAWSHRAAVGGSAIGWQVGTNVLVAANATLDASLLGGWLDASPRCGFQLGVSVDLR